ncbi:anaerobic nitric oxide reductase flavorubredoxin [bacterium]|nr:anaerobic nitric oxide reductase flavorubredoxin [bacterium]MBT3581801.1 anaerobic nitric oxide reductase flavorubredoxin [bacterium]MBT4552491.1 anaerobic nitric oxide reductase flavorubredoxin [bacterium]MBT5988662.1 anaerobic nitric oxide reductase flavorubredoxin [bacterium]
MNLKNNVEWVGKIDWELKKFHGHEYSTHRGSTYNSYLIKEGKNVLIDTVWQPYAKEFVQNLQKSIPLEKIDYIIANHAEMDHSGALPELMKHIPETPIYCTSNALKSLKGHYHQDWNFVPVKTGDTLDIGNGKKLVFVEMTMLHWPDSMACYLTQDNILFSNDAFGQHYASEFMFNDLVDQTELFTECLKYYANILNPFSALVRKKIDEILALKIPIDIIAPSHGVIWRKNPLTIVQKYIEWAKAYQENQITIIYDTMWNGTRKMAETISAGIKKADKKVNIKLYNSATTDKNDILTEIFKSKLILIGSPTVNRGVLTSVAGLLEEIKGLGFKNKKAAAFGAYGWSGESVHKITTLLSDAGFEIVDNGLKALWQPNEDALQQCLEFGNRIAEI